jgi:hypothetical protein
VKVIFDTLYEQHPALPLVWLLLFANGLMGPAIVCAWKKLPFDITKIWQLAQSGSSAAKYAVASWATLLVITLAVLALAIV